MECKKYFKLYKSGKNWCCAAIATVAMATGLVLGGAAHADTNTTSTTQQPVAAQAVTSNTTTSSATPVDENVYGSLDSATVKNNNLQVAGWQASNQAAGKDYRYVIAYDSTTKTELGRTQVTSNVSRPDVAKAYPQVKDAQQSGYDTTMQNINWNKVGSVNDQISIVSRYSNAANGEGQNISTWSQPVQLDKGNYACLDNFSINNNQLQVAGWHATNQALGRNNHLIILFDQTANRELGRKLVRTIYRPDVLKACQQVINAQNSGFSTSFSLAGVDLSHSLRIIDRYSNQANGEGSYVDYWFAPKNFVTGDLANRGSLDSFNLSKAGQIVVSGWNATNLANVENNRYLILFDQTTNQQVGSVKLTNNVARPDVARAVAGVANAGQSGFNYTFSGINLVPGHKYSVVSRYSTSSLGNGNDGAKTDYWFNSQVLNQAANYIDSFTATNNGFHVAGWMTSDYAIDRNNAYVILLQNNREVTRTRIDLTSRPDVARANPNIYNSLMSGFSANLNVDRSKLNGILSLILRFTGSNDGNSNYTDQTIGSYDKNGNKLVPTVPNTSTASASQSNHYYPNPIYTVDVYSGSSDSIINDPHAQGVIIKATQGNYYVNPKCNHQYALAKAAGKLLGLYHYAGGSDPVTEANYFVSSIRNYVHTGILVLDWESYQNSSWGNPNWARYFVNQVHNLTNVWPIIYVQESALWQVANCANDCGLWVAKYPSMNWHSWNVPDMSVSSGAFGHLTGWQYTGDDRDRSIFYLDSQQWMKFANPTV
ncbi:GH25 family lysozyme [Limosilactobacillus pontis]|uniref:GH25 family lysozyme n=1 Tax=Limosilactobacillus pontis TaxID=35787 RepID=A0ABU7SV51_9LACO